MLQILEKCSFLCKYNKYIMRFGRLSKMVLTIFYKQYTKKKNEQKRLISVH